MKENIIEINDLSCRYGSVNAVSNLSLQVPKGSVYAFLGTNGAGKTTTIGTLMNLIKPNAGEARVFGIPSGQIGSQELARIGYLSQDQKMPEGLTVQELINYSKALYPTWDDAFCANLCELMVLPLNRKIRHLSRGMKVKAALLVALAYRPELLVLDEPFSGLDQLVRDELIQSLLKLFEKQDWTLFISTHDMDEVERLADWVGIIDGGRLQISESIESLRARFRRVDVMVGPGQAIPPHLGALKVLQLETGNTTARWVEPHFSNEETYSHRINEIFPADTRVAFTPLTLREIFVAHAQPSIPPISMKILLAQWRKDLQTSRVLFWIWVASVVTTIALSLTKYANVGIFGQEPNVPIDGVGVFAIVSLLVGMMGFFAVQMILMALLLVRVIQADPLTDVQAYWRTKPIPRAALLGAKFFYVLILVVGAALSAWSLNFTSGEGAFSVKLITFILGLAAFATITSNLAELILHWLVVLIVALLSGYFLLEGLRALGFFAQESITPHIAYEKTLIGAAAFPWLYVIYWVGFLSAIACQYFTLKTNVTRLILLLTYLIPAFLQNR